MTRPDRFGLEGAPEIRKARRRPFGRGPFATVLLALLALSGVAGLLAAKSWYGDLGGVVALLCAVLGLVQQRRGGLSDNSALWWYVTGFFTLTLWQRLDRLPQPPLTGTLVWTVLMSIGLPALLLWWLRRR